MALPSGRTRGGGGARGSGRGRGRGRGGSPSAQRCPAAVEPVEPPDLEQLLAQLLGQRLSPGFWQTRICVVGRQVLVGRLYHPRLLGRSVVPREAGRGIGRGSSLSTQSCLEAVESVPDLGRVPAQLLNQRLNPDFRQPHVFIAGCHHDPHLLRRLSLWCTLA